MHPRNPYQNPPDFILLSESYPALKPHLIRVEGRTTIDFHDVLAQKCLTQALLHRDFGLNLVVPDDRLCPPVPNRLNYILWLEDIVNSTVDEKRLVSGVDIGTGASAIYPLLGCARDRRWQFLATDIDAQSLECARFNVTQNALDSRIQIVEVPAHGPIFHDSLVKIQPQVDFTMCNPPFYSDREDISRSAGVKESGPSAVCTGADNEMITPGGEVAFVSRMVQESVVLHNWCRWYSSMLGKMSSLTEIVRLFRELKIDNYAITEFVQGKTRRWAVAWSFTDERLPDSLTRISNPTLQNIMPLRNTLRQPLKSAYSLEQLTPAVQTILTAIEGAETVLNSLPEDHASSLTTHVLGDTWSRAARRKKLNGGLALLTRGSKPALSCRVQIDDGAVSLAGVHMQQTAEKATATLEFHWVRGVDRALFESFMSHVSRKVVEVLRLRDVEMDHCDTHLG